MTFGKAALCAATILCSTQANGAARLFAVHTQGTGIQIGSVFAPNPYTSYALTDLIFNFLLDDSAPLFTVPGVSQGYGGSAASIGASTTGMSFGTRYDYVEGGFSACFSNPSALLPTTVGEIATTCGGTATFRAQGRQFGYVEYTGIVTKVQLLPVDTRERGLSYFAGFSSAVPEPATWAMMFAGFAMTGYALRRRRAAVAFA